MHTVAKSSKAEVEISRRNADRRDADRRKENAAIVAERRQTPRRKVARRRQIDPTTCEREYNDDEIEFMHALDAYKRSSGRMFPTCSEILEVIRAMGYVRITPSGAPAYIAAAMNSEAAADAESAND